MIIKTLDTENLPQTLQRGPVQEAMEEMKMFAQSDAERERYRSRQKARRDHISFLNEAILEGRQQGLQEGRQEGLKIGEKIEQIHNCQMQLKQPLTPRNELAAMSLDSLQALAAALQQQIAKS